MKVAVLGALATLAGCVSLGARGGVTKPLDGAPARTLDGGVELGTFVGVKRALVVPTITYVLGPLGAKSEALPELSVRGFYSHPRWPFAPYVRFSRADECTEPPCRQSISTSIGLALLATSTDDAIIDHLVTSFAALSFGLAYHWQQQDNIGDGHFLGVEMSFTFGGDLVSGVNGMINDHYEDRR